jgi:hypothetical protein
MAGSSSLLTGRQAQTIKIYLIILPLDGGGLRWEWTGCAPPYPLPLPLGEREMTGNSKHQFQMTKTTFHFVEFRSLEVICDLVLACLPVGRELGA